MMQTIDPRAGERADARALRAHSTPEPDQTPDTPASPPDEEPDPAHAPVEEPARPAAPVREPRGD
jgi:hypothetical protein